MQRVVRFDQRYLDAVLAGVKTTTVRWDDPLAIGPAIFVFEDHPDHVHLTGRVTSIRRCALNSLTARDAGAEGSTDVNDYRRSLRSHYPNMPTDAVVDVVTFAIDHATEPV